MMATPKILMVTLPEFGHANVTIAVAQALLEQCPRAELHIASCVSLKPVIDDAFNNVADANINFHVLDGPPLTVCLERDPDLTNRFMSISMLKPGFWNTPTITKYLLMRIFLPWSTDEFVTMFDQTTTLIKSISPDICTVDCLHSPALTAARHLCSQANNEPVTRRCKLVMLSPHSLKDLTHHFEAPSHLFTKWPVMGSAIPMPIPWYLVPFNFYFLLRMTFAVVTDKEQPAKVASIQSATGISDLSVSTYASAIGDGLQHIDRVLVSSCPEVDFPLELVNAPRKYLDKIIGCSPMLRDAAPLMDIDEALAQWMKGGLVVYINLGSLCETSESEAVEMAKALRLLLNESSQRGSSRDAMRVLWKLKKDETRGPKYDTSPGSAVFDILGNEIENDRVRIVDWIKAVPRSVLETGHVVCAITHGGASSFYEAIT